MKKGLIIIILALGPTVAMAADEILYILSARANLLSEPSFKSEIVGSMTRGEKVIEIAKNNNWFKVRYQEKEGWLSRLAVSPNPPTKRVTLLAEHDEQLSNDARRRASTNTNTASVRGLRADADRSRTSDKDTADFAALKKMEGLAIDDQMVAQFLADLKD
ncbi:MAG: SH3 domain-containing protein [Gammaproteobacteria bacterium]|nr:SH3 domain-containing protein [Gammaproteobacteria bacterium]